MRSHNGRTALKYIELGWAVLPLQPNAKRPLGRLVPHAVYDATKDEEVVRRWWSAEPYAGVGIATGPISGGLVVLDADGSVGMHTAHELDLFSIRTPSVATLRGVHWYFHSAEITKSSSGKLGPKIDTQARGSYVCAPPTTINDRRYRWKLVPQLQECAQLPDDLVAMLRAPKSPRPLPTPDAVSQPSRYNSFGGETASGWGGDRSRSGLDAQQVVELVRGGAGEREVYDWFESYSEKFIERAVRDPVGADEYRRRTYSWALQLVDNNVELAVISRANLEVLESSMGRAALTRVRMKVTIVDGGDVVDVKLGVPNGRERNDAMWHAVAPDLEPEKVLEPGGYQLVRRLVQRPVEVVRRGGRIVWMSFFSGKE